MRRARALLRLRNPFLAQSHERNDVTEKIITAKVSASTPNRSPITCACSAFRPMDSTREPDPKGDRVHVVLSGKFLPYKSY